MATAAIWLEKREKLRDSRNGRNDLWLSSALEPATGSGDDIYHAVAYPRPVVNVGGRTSQVDCVSRLSPDRLRQVVAGLWRAALSHSRDRSPGAAEKRMQRFAGARADVVIEKRQQQLETDQKCQRRDHDGSGRHQLIRWRRAPMVQSECKAKAEQRGARNQLKRGQREFPEKVAIENAAERVAQMSGKERRELARNPQVRDFVAVMCA